MKGVIKGDKVLTYWIDGQQVTKEEFDRAFPNQSLTGGNFGACSVKPSLSEALACHPRQVKEAMESAARHGVPTEFMPDGRPVMRSRAHQKAYLKAYGFRNNDGGYGD